MQRRSFLSELKRRNVFRAALLYIGSIWALAQGIASLGPALGAPEWLTKWFVVAAAIGFPIWLMFAWFYELTPEGLKREREVASDESITQQTARKLDIATLAAHDAHELGVNEIGEVIVETQQSLPLARFADDRVAGALLVVDPATNRTSGTLLVRDLLAS